MKSRPPEKANKATDPATHGHWKEMNRKQRRDMMRKIQSEDLRLEVVHPDAAGIDIGNESHYVAVPPNRDGQAVRRYGKLPSWDFALSKLPQLKTQEFLGRTLPSFGTV